MIRYYDADSREDARNNRETAREILNFTNERVFTFGHSQSFGFHDEWKKDYTITLKDARSPRLVVTAKDDPNAPKYTILIDGSTTVDQIFSVAYDKISAIYEEDYREMYRDYLRQQGYRVY